MDELLTDIKQAIKLHRGSMKENRYLHQQNNTEYDNGYLDSLYWIENVVTHKIKMKGGGT